MRYQNRQLKVHFRNQQVITDTSLGLTGVAAESAGVLQRSLLLRMSLSKYHAGELTNALSTMSFSDLPDHLCSLVWDMCYAKFFPATCKRFRALIYNSFKGRYWNLKLPKNPWNGVLHVHKGCVPPNVIMKLYTCNEQILEALYDAIHQTKGAHFIKGLELGYRGKSISPLSSYVALQTLDLCYTTVEDISPLSSCTALQTLGLNHTPIADISPLSSCTALLKLGLANTPIQDITSLSKCTDLLELFLHETKVQDISPLSSCTALQILSLAVTQVQDISPLSNCTALQTLSVSHTQVQNISVLSRCIALQVLGLADTQVQDISSLSSCTALQHLYLDKTSISDISPLSSCVSLQKVSLVDTLVVDITPLSRNNRLKKMALRVNNDQEFIL